jgi:hypothetical protein
MYQVVKMLIMIDGVQFNLCVSYYHVLFYFYVKMLPENELPCID